MKTHFVIEIRPGEGGEDARDLCAVQASIYKSALTSLGASFTSAGSKHG